MKATVKTIIGKSTFVFEFDERDSEFAIAQAAALGSAPQYCNVCGNNDPTKFQLQSRVADQQYLYVEVKCMEKDCWSTATLSKYKGKETFFWHQFKKYVPKNGNDQPEPPQPKEAPAGSESEEDLPF